MDNYKMKILLIEDNPGDARLISEMVKEEMNGRYVLEWFDQLSTGLDRLAEGGIDLILLDLLLPDSRGLDTFSRVYALAPQLPIIVLTGLDDEELAIKTLQQGAQDYLVKGRIEGAEEALRASEKFSSSLLKNSQNPIVVINPDTSLKYVNPSLEKMTGFSSEELIGRKAPYPWWSAEMRRNIGRDLRKAVFTNAVKLERLFQRKDGNRFWVVKTSVRVTIDGVFKYQLKKEINERKHAEEVLKKNKEELGVKSHYLEEANTALKVLIRQREEDKAELQRNVLSNVKELIMPFLDKLKTCHSSADQMAYINIIETNMNNIISPFLRNMALDHFNLTPKEIQVANLIKDGKATKEIAELLYLSVRSVEFHRNNIRKKIGLNNKKANLQSFLASFE